MAQRARANKKKAKNAVTPGEGGETNNDLEGGKKEDDFESKKQKSS